MRFWIILLVILFSGCSNHIDISSYRAVTLKPLSNDLKIDDLAPKTMHVVILNIDDHINSFAQKNRVGHLLAEELGDRLVANRRMQVIKRLEKPTFLNEQKLHELVKQHSVNLENSDYLLTGKITQATRKKSIIKIKEIKKNKKRKRKVKKDIKKVLATLKKAKKIKKRKQKVLISKKISYKVCLNGNIRLFKLPSMQVQDVFSFEKCDSDESKFSSSKHVRPNYNQLMRKIIPKAIDSVVDQISSVAKPQGYVSGMRINKKGDKILKITLNRTLGAVEGRKVKIFKIEKEKNLTGGEDTVEIPIGSGTISDLITSSYSFIIVDELKDEVHRGDVVRVVD